MVHGSMIWSGWVLGRLIVRSSILAHIAFFEYVGEKPIISGCSPASRRGEHVVQIKIFFLPTKKIGVRTE